MYRCQPRILISLLTCLSVSPLFAVEQANENSWYGGFGLGISELNPNTKGTIYSVDDSQDFGYTLYLGYDWTQKISIEGHYSNMGESKISPNGEIGYSAFGLGGLFYFYDPDADHEELGAFAKAGLGKINNESDLPYEQSSNFNVFFGLGLEYGFDNGFGIRTEINLYDKDVRFLTLSLLKRFSPGKKSFRNDDDRDGVLNAVDHCPDTLLHVTVNAYGCELDTDMDGVADRLDKCAQTQRGAMVDDQGCELDTDKDTIPDRFDACPGSASDAQVDHRGCDIPDVVVLEGVRFETGSALLLEDSKNILNNVANTLIRNPKMMVEVAGFTDSSGIREANIRLSQRRAQSVVSYLISRGVASRNLQARGYGPEMPVATNQTALGRAANRRVELHILKR